ncbi:unnamed protein product [Cutaneotrichosporon oleaginosum]
MEYYHISHLASRTRIGACTFADSAPLLGPQVWPLRRMSPRLATPQIRAYSTRSFPHCDARLTGKRGRSGGSRSAARPSRTRPQPSTPPSTAACVAHHDGGLRSSASPT